MTPKSRSAYEQIHSGKWFVMPDLWDFACCHCGLTHRIKARLRDGKIEMQMHVNGPATGGRRRALKQEQRESD